MGSQILITEHFTFDSTGNDEVDDILAAVAFACRFDRPENWSKQFNENGSPVDFIQNAANDLAKSISKSLLMHEQDSREFEVDSTTGMIKQAGKKLKDPIFGVDMAEPGTEETVTAEIENGAIMSMTTKTAPDESS